MLGHVETYIELLRDGVNNDVDLRVFETRGLDGQAAGWIEQPLFLTEDETLVRKWAAL